MTILSNDEQPLNAEGPIEVTPLGIVYEVKPAGAKDFPCRSFPGRRGRAGR